MPGPLTRRQALFLPFAAASIAAPPRWSSREIRRVKAAEATQAVAVDEQHFYAIANFVIGKYDKRTGERVSGWSCERGKPLLHLNSGLVRDGVLYCAHSNFPALPMVSSIEMWDTKTMRHMASHSFGVFVGSATWVDFYQGRRYVTFGHYSIAAAETNTDPRWTTLIEFDSEWRRLQAWMYPEEVVKKMGHHTISGGMFSKDGKIFCSGHDEPEVYVLALPRGGGSTLVLEDTFATTNPGQGIAWDPSDASILCGIDRRTREIVVMRLSQS